jgi:DNA-binding transcriptional LysR family regulator
MIDRFEAMSLLVASVEGGSFSAASRKLGVPLAAVTGKIAELEAHLQTRLVARTTRRLTLTDAGVRFLAASKRILDQVGEAERAATGEYVTPRGELVITAPVAFGRLHVLPVVSAFLAEHPQITVQLVLSDRDARLVDDQVDVAVRIGAPSDSSLAATRVGSVARVAVASPALLAIHGEPRSPEDLARMACIAYDGVADGAVWTFAGEDGGRGRRVRIQPRLTVNSAEAAVDAAAAGVGVTQVLSYQAAPSIAARRLSRVLTLFEEPPQPVSLLHAGQTLLPLKTRSFLAFAAPRLRKALGAAGWGPGGLSPETDGRALKSDGPAPPSGGPGRRATDWARP